MADTRLTKISFAQAVYLCLLAIFLPRKLIEAEKADNEKRKDFPQPPPPTEHNVLIVRRAFWCSLLLVVSFAVAGYGVGRVIDCLLGYVTKTVITVLQITGAMLLLWATLFIRGWEIQSYGGVSLTERVNKWLYRALYCVGTAVIICSLALSSHP